MKSMRLIGSLSCMMLVMAISAVAQPSSSPAPVLDSAGRPLQRGVEYYINPAITDSGGRFTLIDRNGSCPLYVGQENGSGLEGLPVIFTPFVEGETVIRENRDFRVAFSAATICVQSTAWKLGEKDPESNRRLIVTGEDQSSQRTANYFRIEKASVGGDIYQISWCPTDVCPTCRFDCGTAGNLVENGKRLLALDGNVIPVTFERKA
ncbi:kunitz type trypsin inhibitor 104-like [Quercus robur]|uniref:kunitz type trypsin inhibitor 104-like n=1 Tax=Quercus robur TaxID=38942 RepID=UPI00216231A5|nr:kunitz type trypsin inhibitor 104-like [Quercus robur]XP_050252956.1 kunitz type trypsin inhibitor 104-like [Quercus robur]